MKLVKLKTCLDFSGHYNEKHSAQFFGLLLCQVLIDREETWFFLRQDDIQGMKYFMPEEKFKEEIEEKVTASFDDLKNKFRN